MATRPITRFVDIQIKKDIPRISEAGFNILMIITDSALLSTSRRSRSFTTVDSVADFFGKGSEEEAVADAFFNQDPFNKYHPDILQFGRFADDATTALLEMGDSPLLRVAEWQAISDGEFQIAFNGGSVVEITGCDFTKVTSMDDVAAVINAKLGINGDCYFNVNRFNIGSTSDGISSMITPLSSVITQTGTDISGAGFLDGDIIKSPTNLGGAVLSQGQEAETFEAALTAIGNVNDDWYAMGAIKKYRDTAIAEDMVLSIETRRKIFIITTNDPNVLIYGANSFSKYIKDLNYKQTGTIYHDNYNFYPDVSWMGQQLPKPVGSTNWAYKKLAGRADGAAQNITSVFLTRAEKDAALNANCNLYSSILGSEFTYFGTMGGGKNTDKEGEFIDIIRNIDFLQARIEEGLFSLLSKKDIIPFTNAGISMVDNRLKSLLEKFGVKQGILVEGSVKTFFPKRSEVSKENKDDRLLPDGTFQAELAGAVNTIIIRGTVFV